MRHLHWRAAPSLRSRRVGKQRELAKRVVAKQLSATADLVRAARAAMGHATCASRGLRRWRDQRVPSLKPANLLHAYEDQELPQAPSSL